MNVIQDPHMVISKSLGSDAELFMHTFALGWDILVYRGHLVFDKPGGYMGVTSQVVFLPFDEIGLILFANLRSQMAYWIITGEILDRLLGLEPFRWTELAWPQEENYIERIVENLQPLSNPEDTLDPTMPLNAFTGKFRNRGTASELSGRKMVSSG
jgi:hypothetical protein